MYIVKRLIELNNGHIAFEAVPNTLTKYSNNGLEILYQKDKIILTLG